MGLRLIKFYSMEIKTLTTVLDGNVSCQCYREKRESNKDTKHFLKNFIDKCIFGLSDGYKFPQTQKRLQG